MWVAVLCALGAAWVARGEDAGVEWLGSYRDGLRQAKNTGKPLFVEFRCEA
jgi:hypothetical protein